MNATEQSITEALARFETACRGVGLRMTHQRLAIYRELLQAADHPAAEALHRIWDYKRSFVDYNNQCWILSGRLNPERNEMFTRGVLQTRRPQFLFTRRK